MTVRSLRPLPGGADVVLAERLQHLVAGEPGVERRVEEARAIQGRMSPWNHTMDCRRIGRIPRTDQTPLDLDEEDQQQADEERRERVADQGEAMIERSCHLPRFDAATMPDADADDDPQTKAPIASCAVTGSALVTRSVTCSPLRNE
jgi:hypothetical protein